LVGKTHPEHTRYALREAPYPACVKREGGMRAKNMRSVMWVPPVMIIACFA
jgi:hypothetical protein